MGFFRRTKATTTMTSEQQQQQQRQDELMAQSSFGGKKEPLLMESVPDDEPVMVDRNDARPDWTDVDGTDAEAEAAYAAAQWDDAEEGDTDLSLPPGYREELLEKRKTKGCMADFCSELGEILQKAWEAIRPKLILIFGCCGVTTGVLIAIYIALTAGTLALLLLAGGGTHNVVPGLSGDLTIAFIGNSYFFVNDFPRLFEKVTGDHIFQDSCIHGSGSVLNILKTGNGMYYKWMTQNAMINGVEWMTQGSTITYLYDYGACSVPQLLTGQDKMLSYGNQYGHYIDDGSNPCLLNDDYLDYENSFNYTQKWDYVVIVDQSKRMCFDDARAEALMAFNYTYGPLLDRGGSTPVLIQPHAFWSANVNMTGLTDVPTFTYMIMEGAKIYKEFLDTKLSNSFHKTKIAPVGDAFLTVWEEDQDLWSKLFLGDGVHPSGYGSYLYAMVLHATIYGVMPPKSRVILDDPMDLFYTARRLHSNETSMPDRDEALALWKIARRVGVYGHRPSSLKSVGQDEVDGDYEYTDDHAGYDGSEGYEYNYNETTDYDN